MSEAVSTGPQVYHQMPVLGRGLRNDRESMQAFELFLRIELICVKLKWPHASFVVWPAWASVTPCAVP